MHLFISDAHIRTDASHRAKTLIKFLRDTSPEMTHLYILGDLFEFWFEYNVVLPKNYFRTLATLHNLLQNGKTIHYVLGNHEVMIGSFLKDFGFIVHPGQTTLSIDGKRVFMAHGNNIDKRLWTSLWEGLMTSRFNHALYRLIHPDVGVFLAQAIAYLSRKLRPSPHLMAMLENYARSKFNEVDIVMLAHSHIPVLKELNNNKYYVNTGDWIEHFSYGVIDNGKVSLHYYRP